MNKYLIIFLVGILETFLYTGYLISVELRQKIISSILMFVYMSIYLSVIAFAIKDVNSLFMILVYAFSCSIGNYLRVSYEKQKKKRKAKRPYKIG